MYLRRLLCFNEMTFWLAIADASIKSASTSTCLSMCARAESFFFFFRARPKRGGKVCVIWEVAGCHGHTEGDVPANRRWVQ